MFQRRFNTYRFLHKFSIQCGERFSDKKVIEIWAHISLRLILMWRTTVIKHIINLHQFFFPTWRLSYSLKRRSWRKRWRCFCFSGDKRKTSFSFVSWLFVFLNLFSCVSKWRKRYTLKLWLMPRSGWVETMVVISLRWKNC